MLKSPMMFCICTTGEVPHNYDSTMVKPTVAIKFYQQMLQGVHLTKKKGVEVLPSSYLSP